MDLTAFVVRKMGQPPEQHYKLTLNSPPIITYAEQDDPWWTHPESATFNSKTLTRLLEQRTWGHNVYKWHEISNGRRPQVGSFDEGQDVGRVAQIYTTACVTWQGHAWIIVWPRTVKCHNVPEIMHAREKGDNTPPVMGLNQVG